MDTKYPAINITVIAKTVNMCHLHLSNDIEFHDIDEPNLLYPGLKSNAETFGKSWAKAWAVTRTKAWSKIWLRGAGKSMDWKTIRDGRKHLKEEMSPLKIKCQRRWEGAGNKKAG